MSRPKKATVDYFPHKVNHGKTMFTIESKYGNDGYAFWFKLLELLGSTEHHYLDCNDPETWEYLLAKTRLNEETALNILETCSKLNAIVPELWGIKIIRSENFIENLDEVYKRRDIDVLTNAEILDLCKQKYPLNGVSVNINPQSKVKKTKLKEIIYSDDFLTFWNEYPNKEKKKDSFIAWEKAKNKPSIEILIQNIKDHKRTDKWKKGFIPLPTTFLNGRLWEDEIKPVSNRPEFTM